MAKALTHSQIGQLGGFASARAAGHDELADRGSKGGSTTLATHGREHYIRAAHKRWGRLKSATKGDASEENNMVLAQTERPRHPGEGMNGTSSGSATTTAA